jgi:hypothetical protein
MAEEVTLNEKQKREARVEEHMRVAGMTRAEAEFAVAQELGEIEGDIVVVDDDEEE